MEEEKCETATPVQRHMEAGPQELEQELFHSRLGVAGSAALLLTFVCKEALEDTAQAVEQLELAKPLLPVELSPLVAAVETYIHEMAGFATGVKRN